MIQTGRGQWAVSWQYVSTVNDSHGYYSHWTNLKVNGQYKKMVVSPSVFLDVRSMGIRHDSLPERTLQKQPVQIHRVRRLLTDPRVWGVPEREYRVLTHLSNLLDTQSIADVIFVVTWWPFWNKNVPDNPECWLKWKQRIQSEFNHWACHSTNQTNSTSRKR